MVLINNRSPPRYSGTMFTVLAMQVTFCCNPEQSLLCKELFKTNIMMDTKFARFSRTVSAR